MSWQKRQIFNIALTGLFLLALGCGVKGDPLPPEKPAELGRGRPTFKGASEEIKIEKNRKATAPKGDGEDSDDEDKE